MFELLPPVGAAGSDPDKARLFDDAGVGVAGAVAGTGKEGSCSGVVACPETSGSGALL